MIVSAAILMREGRVFLARRGPTLSHPGMWLPGGKVEPGETPEQALVRELREELGIAIRCGALRARATAAELPGIELLAFECEIASGDIALKEHDDCRWVRPDEMIRYPMTALERALVPHLL